MWRMAEETRPKGVSEGEWQRGQGLGRRERPWERGSEANKTEWGGTGGQDLQGMRRGWTHHGVVGELDQTVEPDAHVAQVHVTVHDPVPMKVAKTLQNLMRVSAARPTHTHHWRGSPKKGRRGRGGEMRR